MAEIRSLSIPEGLPVLFRDLIHEHTGTYFDETRLDVMLEKIQPLVAATQSRSLMDYYFKLKYGEHSDWLKVLDALSVQETYFWREMDQIHALAKELVPKWFSRRVTPLNIWSAACATGEEPYTIAIALNEAGFSHLPIRIVASDASCAAIEKAKQGRYRERSFRTLPAELRAKYFTQERDGAQLRPDIMRKVTFECRNLVERSDVAVFAHADVIFCRNVFIYFSHAAITRTVEWMADYMPADGHLFVGASESLLKLTKRFELHEIGGAFVYIRKDDQRPAGGKP